MTLRNSQDHVFEVESVLGHKFPEVKNKTGSLYESPKNDDYTEMQSCWLQAPMISDGCDVRSPEFKRGFRAGKGIDI